ncbi:MAG: alpha/beta hydrolase [Burkholderiales bacterium]|nr:alpha/beta hydrolase [Burkholderiales bacterium]
MPLNIVAAVAIAYAAIVLLLFIFQSRLVYFPQIGREIAATPQAYGLEFESVNITTEDGETLHAWWVPAQDARGTILFFHGNAGNISHRIDYLRMFRKLGLATLIFDYRGYGNSTGTPSEEGTYRDAVAAWRWLTQTRGLGPENIVYVGESLGGAVASGLAEQHAPRALVLLSTFTSAPDLGAQVYPFIPVRLISRFSYDNLARIGRIKVPVLVAHSRDDDIVPFAHGRRIFEAAGEPKQFLEMRGGHNDGFIFMREEWVRALAAFLEQHGGTSRSQKN